MKINLAIEITEYFSSYVSKYNKAGSESWDVSCSNDVTGDLYWIKPDDVLWLHSVGEEEAYEGSQTQFGVKQDGTIVWGYFSHCSCYGYEDYSGEYTVYEETEHQSQKVYELDKVEKDILIILKAKLDRMLGIGIKDIQQEKYDKSVEPKGLPSTKDEASTADTSGDGESPVDNPQNRSGVESGTAKEVSTQVPSADSYLKEIKDLSEKYPDIVFIAIPKGTTIEKILGRLK